MTAATVALTLLAAASCARTTTTSSEDPYDKVLKSWVRVNYGDLAPNDSGVFVLNYLPGSGKAVTDTSYVCVHYVRKDLSGNILSTNYVDVCKQLGTYSATDYYGSDIWRMGYDCIVPGLEQVLLVGPEWASLPLPDHMLPFPDTEAARHWLEDHPVSGATILVIVCIFDFRTLLNLIERRHTHIDVSARDKFLRIAIEEGQKKRSYMRTVLIGIRKDYDFMILQVFKLEILTDAGS